jgi:poly-gamma-glutamate capsule biosynthesis protein CapA/YwtB (metallophosphatase superfamily)
VPAIHHDRSPWDAVTLLLTGDVMLGRGIDQILPHPVDPRLYEPQVNSAVTYVELAEAANGPISRPVGFSYVWGDALVDITNRADVRIINLETAITASQRPALKDINYRVSPQNAACLSAAKIDCCVLANNHVLDWGEEGLRDTLATLRLGAIAHAGAGRDRREAVAPAILPLADGGRVLVFGFGSRTAGIPQHWAAGENRAGINLLGNLSDRTVADVASMAGAVRRGGDLLVASIHWGGNWGYAIPDEQRRFAHGLIDVAGIDIVHGHSSHHAKGFEIYRQKLVLYGCGDFLNDYEGIAGYESFRDDLAIAYLAKYSCAGGRLIDLTLIPFQIRKFRLNSVSAIEMDWLRAVLNRECGPFGIRIEQANGKALRALCDKS